MNGLEKYIDRDMDCPACGSDDARWHIPIEWNLEDFLARRLGSATIHSWPTTATTNGDET